MVRRLLSFVFCLAAVTAVSAGRIDSGKVYSAAMDREVEVTIVVPTKGEGPCPVVYLLHGAFGHERSWLEIRPDLADVADREHLIFVTPRAHNTWYFDSPLHPQVRYETFLSSELIDYIDSHYNTIATREGRAITGLSMGGHGAFHTALRHPDKFGAVGSTSGGVDFRPFPQNWNIQDELGEMASNKQTWDEHVVVNLIDRIQNGQLAIIFDCGESDFFLEVNKDLHQRLLGRGIDHDFILRPGSHNGEYWANSIDYQILFFQKYFKTNH